MRETKFRGKRMDNSAWVYGSLVIHTKGECSIIDYANHERELYEWHDVIPETVGEFTGLKDAKGVEIYEGDIVKTIFKSTDGTLKIDIAEVKYDTINPCFVMEYKYKGNGHLCHEYDFVTCNMRTNEIIGNIYDNPELINN